jgi:hypothetical protein
MIENLHGWEGSGSSVLKRRRYRWAGLALRMSLNCIDPLFGEMQSLSRVFPQIIPPKRIGVS